jgi:hypothetical protein
MTIKDFKKSHPNSIGNLCFNCKKQCLSVAGAHTCDKFEEYNPHAKHDRGSIKLSGDISNYVGPDMDTLDHSLEAAAYLNKISKMR